MSGLDKFKKPNNSSNKYKQLDIDSFCEECRQPIDEVWINEKGTLLTYICPDKHEIIIPGSYKWLIR